MYILACKRSFLREGGAHCLRDGVPVNLLDLGDAVKHFGRILLAVFALVDRVAGELHVLERWQLVQAAQLAPRLHLVVAHEEGVQVSAAEKAVELVNLVVGDPELFKRVGDVLEARDSLDSVSAEREHLQLTELRELHLLDGVGREGQLLDTLESGERLVQLLQLGEEAEHLDLGGVTGVLA